MKNPLRQDGCQVFAPSSMRMAIEPLAEILAEWERLAARDPEAVFYQREPWLSTIARVYGLEFRAATLRDRAGELAAACLFARSRNPFGRRWTSLPCADAAPPLAVDEEARNRLLVSIAGSEFARGLLEVRGYAAPEPWKTANCFADWRLDLDRPLNAIQRSMAQNFRRQLNRGHERQFTIEADRTLNGLRRFYRLMLETRRRLGVPAQPWRFFRTVFDAMRASGNLEVWMISQGGRTVSAMVLLKDGDALHYKWSARSEPTPTGASHRLVAAVLERYAQQYRYMGLGRTDVRNVGLNRFKKEMGAKSYPLPYSFLPRIPAQVSAEVLDESRQWISRVWRRLPLPLTQLLGSVLYRYLV